MEIAVDIVVEIIVGFQLEIVVKSAVKANCCGWNQGGEGAVKICCEKYLPYLLSYTMTPCNHQRRT